MAEQGLGRDSKKKKNAHTHKHWYELQRMGSFSEPCSPISWRDTEEEIAKIEE